MDTTDHYHWRRIREIKSRERKELKEKTNDIYRNTRSPSYNYAQKERWRQELERNEKAIQKLDEAINMYDCKLWPTSPDKNIHSDRGRSKTPGPTAWNATQVHAERRSRSASRLQRDKYDDDKHSRKVSELEREIEHLNDKLMQKDTALQNLKNETIPKLRRERDECQAEVLEKNKFYDSIHEQLQESERRSRLNSAYCKEMLLKYQEENKKLRDENLKKLTQYQVMHEKVVEYEGKSSSLSERVRIEKEEKSRLKRENDLLQTQLNSVIRQKEWTDENIAVSKKVKKENDRLKEEVAAYQRQALKVSELQQNEIEMTQQLDELKKRNEQLNKEQRENETSLMASRNQYQEIERLQSVIRSNEKVEERLRQAIGILEKKHEAQEIDMKPKLDDITKRNEQLKREKSADESIMLSIQDHKTKITQLQSVIRSKEIVEDGLRQTIADLEKKCETVQRDVYERLNHMEDQDNKKKQLKERNDKELQRLRQLEIMHENNIKSMRSMESNHTDLEKKNQQLQAEKDMLLKKESMQQNETKRLQNKLDTEEKESAVLRERIKELERQNVPRYDLGMIEENRRLLAETEQLKKEFSECKQKLGRLKTTYENDVESLKSNHTDLDKKVQHLKDEKERNEQSQRRIAEELQSDLETERKISADLRKRITDLINERSEKIKLERHQVSVENDREFTRLRRSKKAYKNETETLKTEQADLQKIFELLEEERDQLVESEETERKMGEKLQRELDDAKREVERLQDKTQNLERSEKIELERHQVSVENDREFNRLRRSEKAYKNEAEILKTELADLQKKFELLGDERDKLVESEESKRKIGEHLQRELENATREVERLQDNIKKQERKAAIKTDEFGSLTLTATTASQEFNTIFKREWNDAFKALSDSGLQENEILHGLHDLLTKCVGDAELECSEITKTVCRYRYFQTDPSPALVRMFKLAGLKAVVPHKTKQILQNQSNEDNGIPIPVPLAVKTYVQRCTEMAMLVRILFPQLRIVLEMESSHLNTQQYEVISGEGNLIDIVVWPYIMENGTVVQKGYVKVCSSKKTPSVSKNKEEATGNSKSNDISDTEDHKYSDIEGTLIYKRNDQGKEESRNDTDSESTSSMAESLTNYDLTSDFSKSFSIRQQQREDDFEGK